MNCFFMTKPLLALFLIAGIAMAVEVNAQSAESNREALFKEADAVLKQAQDKQADFFSPKSFTKGMKSYEKAVEDFAAEKKIETIQDRLKDAVENFRKALEVALRAEELFAEAIAGRHAAMAVEVSQYAAGLWEKAEDKFKYARRYLEDGDKNTAKSRSKEAADLYREAELRAIKAKHLAEAWAALEKAKSLNAKRNAPKTLEKAQSLVEKTEDILQRDRYNTGEVSSLIQAATYHANHAIFLNQKINAMKAEGKTHEDYLIEAISPIQQIADALGESVSFENGVDQPAQAIINGLRQLQEESALLANSLKVKDDDITELIKQRTEKEQVLRERETELAELRLANNTLLMRIQQLQTLEEQVRDKELQSLVYKQKLNKIARSFNADEAKVSQTAKGEIMIRLSGLTFPDGKAVIEPKYFSLLAKVNEAIGEFPESKLIIEGHTDSADNKNEALKLSQERAVAVMEYIIANAGVKRERITASGYGGQFPIDANETDKGRANNRRIDILIQPVK